MVRLERRGGRPPLMNVNHSSVITGERAHSGINIIVYPSKQPGTLCDTRLRSETIRVKSIEARERDADKDTHRVKQLILQLVYCDAPASLSLYTQSNKSLLLFHSSIIIRFYCEKANTSSCQTNAASTPPLSLALYLK